MHFKLFLSLFVNVVVINLVKGSIVLPVRNEAFNKDLYEEVLDAELCDQQIQIIRNNTLISLFFADAGMRVPRGVLEGNTMDMGNYHQCIGLNQNIADTELQGKYCMIRVPLNQTFVTPWMNSETNFNPNNLRLDSETIKSLRDFYAMKNGMNALTGAIDVDRLAPNNPLASLTFRLAVCVPKPCTTEQAINSFMFNMTAVGFQYDDDFCRLPDDKPWVPGDTVIVVLFSIIGLLTIVSTSYDIWHTIILKKDPKTVSVIGRCFSVYTNGRRVMNFQSSPNSIECLDGIRAMAMLWVVLGHTFSSVAFFQNPLDAFTWATSWQSLWITSATVTVDTFFTLSGFLVVYTALGKFNSMQLLKNIHLFWLNRLLRMFPLLAVAVLFEATYLHRMADGPVWEMVEDQVNRCRTYWWSTLLHMQNYMNPTFTCVGQTWYLAIDVQLHILSPIILFWVLMGKQRIAWAALLSVLAAVLTASTTYIFIKEFPSTMMGQPDRMFDYIVNYYMNTLTRASPFFVGMLFGYIVKTKKLEMSKIGTVCYWAACFTLSTFIIYTSYPINQADWDNQVADSLYNSFIRPLWGLFIGCMIFACFNGYGGPINWFLSLSVWKLQSRMSYGIYLFHYGLMNAVNFSAITPPFFSVKSYVFKFLAHYSLAFAVTFFLVLLIDAPCSTLFKILLGGGGKKPHRKEIDEDPTKDVEKIS
ncbi:nose resistant to fluoxetine protein 6 [Helicoverpa armigera]|uniref:nose resistant to fluoxetine protein 6 n=1 Tax=Helicoverpa armigera TaxID=29058 RepID=UPI00308355E0